MLPVFFLYKMKNSSLLLFLFVSLLSSCLVQSPKYTSIDQVMSLEPGMTKDQVEERLGVKPYDVKLLTDTSKVYIYVYRVSDRKTLSFNTKPVNGRKTTGKYVQLDVTYSMQDSLISIETCRMCPDNLTTTSKINVEKMVLFVTVTLPVLLIYFGLK